MLKTRVLTVLLLLPLFLAALFLLPQMGWALLMLGVVLIGAREWSKISAFSGFQGWVYVLLTLFIGLALLPRIFSCSQFHVVWHCLPFLGAPGSAVAAQSMAYPAMG